jgi:hypothetical protein
MPGQDRKNGARAETGTGNPGQTGKRAGVENGGAGNPGAAVGNTGAGAGDQGQEWDTSGKSQRLSTSPAARDTSPRHTTPTGTVFPTGFARSRSGLTSGAYLAGTVTSTYALRSTVVKR